MKASEQQNTKIDNTESNSFSRPIKGNTKRDSRSIHCRAASKFMRRKKSDWVDEGGGEKKEDNIVIIELIEHAVNLVSSQWHEFFRFSGFCSIIQCRMFQNIFRMRSLHKRNEVA
jgi:hypothetical protein